jgi:hypothetical protein
MGKRLDIKPGDRFSRWTILKEVNYQQGTRRFLCCCECGTERIVRLTHLIQGVSKSCGCYRKDEYTTHGATNTRIYTTWADMKQRCSNPKCTSYKRYGGRGIKFCSEWMNFQTFYEWAINNGYKDDLTIERKDVNGDYCPENCEWVSLSEQAQNRRDCCYITYKGETKNITQWSKCVGISRGCLYHRLHNGWTVEEAFNTPSQRGRIS